MKNPAAVALGKKRMAISKEERIAFSKKGVEARKKIARRKSGRKLGK